MFRDRINEWIKKFDLVQFYYAVWALLILKEVLFFFPLSIVCILPMLTLFIFDDDNVSSLIKYFNTLKEHTFNIGLV